MRAVCVNEERWSTGNRALWHLHGNKRNKQDADRFFTPGAGAASQEVDVRKRRGGNKACFHRASLASGDLLQPLSSWSSTALMFNSSVVESGCNGGGEEKQQEGGEVLLLFLYRLVKWTFQTRLFSWVQAPQILLLIACVQSVDMNCPWCRVKLENVALILPGLSAVVFLTISVFHEKKLNLLHCCSMRGFYIR